MSATWKQLLESGSYTTAVCDFDSSRKKPMNLCENSGASLVAESSTSEHESIAGYKVKEKPLPASDSSKESSAIKKTVDHVRLRSLTGQEEIKLVSKKDVLGHFHNASPEDSAKKLQAMNKKLDVELNKDGKVQLAELATMVRALKKEMEIVEAVELDVSRDSLWDMVKEGSSLRSLLESLELKLETFLSQKPELKDNKASTVKILKRGCELEASLVGPESGVPSEEYNKADLLRTKSCRAALHAAEQLTLAVEEVYKDKAFQARALNKMATLSGGTDAICVSNSESYAKILTSGEKFKSSREKAEEPNNLADGEVAAAMSQADADLNESSFPEFSIRNFVSTARDKDMNVNWPFSRRSLKLCMKSGVKNVLPPFQSLDSVRNKLTKHGLAQTVSSAERSRLDENPCWLKNHPVSGSFYRGFDQKSALLCTDSNSTPSGPPGNQDFVLETTAHSQSEMESVSTSKIPLSEASDKQGAAGSAVRQKTKSTSINIPNKKRKLVVKLGANINRGTAEDITSVRSLPPEVVAPKTCPVCGNFSSPSNTTLNAHIDQCLSVEPSSEWMKSSQTVKPRLKPRKIRLMSDICATAPCCTLEELDIRNGRLSVADANLASHTNRSTEGRSQRDSLNHVKDNDEDRAVYVDANGTKIRILSKTNDASSVAKSLKDLKIKSIKKAKRSKFFPSNKKHLARCLKVSEAYGTKACVDEKANLTVGENHQEEELFLSSEIHEQNKIIQSGKSMPNLFTERTVLSENNCTKRRRGRPKGKVRDTRDLLAVSRKPSANKNIYKDIEKPFTGKTGIDTMPNSIKRNRLCKVVIDEKDQCPRRQKSIKCSPFSVKNQFTSKKSFVPEDSEATQIHSPDEVDPNDMEQNDLLTDATEILLKDSHDPKGTSSGQLHTDSSTYSGVERSHLCTIDEVPVALSSQIGQQCNSMEADVFYHHDKNELIGCTSSAKLPPGRSSDPELHKLTKPSACGSNLLQFAGNLFGAANAVDISQDIDIQGMFNATEGGIDGMDQSSEDIEQGTSFPLVDTISIPGPPGSYLPSFRDSCFGYLQGSSSLANGWNFTKKTKNMIRKEQTHSNGYPKIRVGEIDTSAPFQSVKHAVNLFGEVAFSAKRPAIKNLKPYFAEEHVYVRDTQGNIAEKELEKLKERLRNTEDSKAKAVVELEKARKKAEDLTQKLKAINESKEASLKATEAAKIQAKRLEEVNLAVNNADLNVLKELNAAKQDLTKFRQEYDASVQAKTRAVNLVEEAEYAVKVNTKRAQELLEEITAVKKTTEQVHQATIKGKQELAKGYTEKEVKRQTYEDYSEESAKVEFDPKLIKHLQIKLAEKMSQISSLQKNVNDAKASDLENQRADTLELESAKESLQEVAKEENVLHKLVDSLKQELEKMRIEHMELREKEAETESEAGNLNVKLTKIKSELEICLAGEAKARGSSEEMITAVNQVKAEKASAQQEAEHLKMEAEKLVIEAEETRGLLQESEKLLNTTLKEADQAKADEEIALEKIKIISEITNSARSSTSESGVKITLSRDEFESLSRKTQESDKLALLKVDAAMAQVEAVKASENEAMKKLEATQKEIEDIKACTEEALKRAEMADAAKKAIKGELKRWGEKEQMKAAEVPSNIMVETQTQVIETHQESPKNSPIHPKIQKKKSEVRIVTKKMEKRSSLSKKAMKPSFSSIFLRKNSQVDSGSPSHLI
ncbi:hypothetical protein V2J09_015190 [Rumex salicifolius]